jgi:hypothetical protein
MHVLILFNFFVKQKNTAVATFYLCNKSRHNQHPPCEIPVEWVVRIVESSFLLKFQMIPIFSYPLSTGCYFLKLFPRLKLNDLSSKN